MKVRIFVQPIKAGFVGIVPHMFRAVRGWTVSAETHKKVLRRTPTLGFLRAISLTSQYLDEYPDAEIRMPPGMKNVVVV
jgi:hypothetical protein